MLRAARVEGCTRKYSLGDFRNVLVGVLRRDIELLRGSFVSNVGEVDGKKGEITW